MEKSILKKIIFIMILNAFIILILTVKSNAASLSISTSKSTVAPGESFTVTVKLNNGAGYVTSGGQTQWLDNSSFSYTKTAGSSGSVTVTASGTAADYSTEKDQKVSASKTVKIVKPTSSSGGNSSGNSGGNTGGSTGGNSGNSNNKPTTTTQPPTEVKKSTDNTLSALSIEEGQISPEFSNDVKEYVVAVSYEVTELNVTATPSDSKAKTEIIGNKDLQEGENILTVRVTAEDGSVADYVVKVTRARIPLALKSLVIKYQNENGELIETALDPVFSFDVFEYSLEEMEYWIEKLSVEAIPNIEGASIDVQGADSLQAGENTVIITAKIPAEVAEGEEPKEEIITYTIKVNKKQEPTTMEKLSNWYNQNEEYVIIGALGVCVAFLFGLSIYIIVDHNKYKHIIKRVKEENDFKSNIFEETNDEISEEEKDTTKTGKRFK